MRTRLLILMIAAISLAACERQATVQTLSAKLEPGYQVHTPSGDGPFPVVLLFHGCGGLVGEHGEKEIMGDYAAAAIEDRKSVV